MGYHSDVVLAIDKDKFEESVLLNALFPSGLFKLESNTFFDYVDVGDECYTFNYNGKWYGSYDEVARIEAFLGTLEDCDFGFIRVGEECGDVELEGEPYEFGYFPRTSIERV